MSTLERAIVIAAEGHSGTTDKGGNPYILHPLRVMAGMRSDEERIVAVLHDVVEDCEGWTFERLRSEGFSETVIAALDSVTKREGEDYEGFVARASLNEIGRRVKRGDLIDNLDATRISQPTDRDRERLAKYQAALATLEGR